MTFDDQVGEDVAHDCMAAAVDAGVNFFDNAEGYASGRAETMMGNVIQKAGWKRSDLVLSTKLFWGGDGPNDTGLSVSTSPRRSRGRSSDSRRTTWTCCSATVPTPRRRSRRRCGP